MSANKMSNNRDVSASDRRLVGDDAKFASDWSPTGNLEFAAGERHKRASRPL